MELSRRLWGFLVGLLGRWLGGGQLLFVGLGKQRWDLAWGETRDGISVFYFFLVGAKAGVYEMLRLNGFLMFHSFRVLVSVLMSMDRLGGVQVLEKIVHILPFLLTFFVIFSGYFFCVV